MNKTEKLSQKNAILFQVKQKLSKKKNMKQNAAILPIASKPKMIE